jgi:type I restriction enzyme R subunit
MQRSEQATRQQLIDPKLEEAGWIIQNRDQMNLYAGRGVAVREFPLTNGEADYLLFVDRKALVAGQNRGICGGEFSHPH